MPLIARARSQPMRFELGSAVVGFLAAANELVAAIVAADLYKRNILSFLLAENVAV